MIILGNARKMKSMNGIKMLKFLENNKMKALNDRALKPEARRIRTRKCTGRRERSVLDYSAAEHGNSNKLRCIRGRRCGNYRLLPDVDKRPADER